MPGGSTGRKHFTWSSELQWLLEEINSNPQRLFFSIDLSQMRYSKQAKTICKALEEHEFFRELSIIVNKKASLRMLSVFLKHVPPRFTHLSLWSLLPIRFPNCRPIADAVASLASLRHAHFTFPDVASTANLMRDLSASLEQRGAALPSVALGIHNVSAKPEAYRVLGETLAQLGGLEQLHWSMPLPRNRFCAVLAAVTESTTLRVLGVPPRPADGAAPDAEHDRRQNGRILNSLTNFWNLSELRVQDAPGTRPLFLDLPGTNAGVFLRALTVHAHALTDPLLTALSRLTLATLKLPALTCALRPDHLVKIVGPSVRAFSFRPAASTPAEMQHLRASCRVIADTLVERLRLYPGGVGATDPLWLRLAEELSQAQTLERLALPLFENTQLAHEILQLLAAALAVREVRLGSWLSLKADFFAEELLSEYDEFLASEEVRETLGGTGITVKVAHASYKAAGA
eukprot:gnl/Chilomastix_cuspidata/42.p1 GENE.gnl/Chilomastix_cuspidata/42~~gnl/Chilomastix_cuspidata/42.p1  ORF type:complete len:459 (+),score=226.90 gnl/Chilomastix_cuspidata/42:42-1418(+)